MDRHTSDTELLAAYVAAFGKPDDMCLLGAAATLKVDADARGLEHWRPRRVTTPPSSLDSLYRGLGLPGLASSRFPPLYEALLLSYRWAEVDLGSYRLLANEPAEDLAPLLAVMLADKGLHETLRPNGYVQFGRGTDGDYDPVCFDFRQRHRNGDCRIVRLDHEAILCDGRIRETAELAPDFRSLVLDTIRLAALR